MGERESGGRGRERDEVAAHAAGAESLPELIAAARELVGRASKRAQLDLLWERIDAVFDEQSKEQERRPLRRHAR